MNNWPARVILFLVVGAGSIVSLHYRPAILNQTGKSSSLTGPLPDFHKFLNIEKHRSTDFLRTA